MTIACTQPKAGRCYRCRARVCTEVCCSRLIGATNTAGKGATVRACHACADRMQTEAAELQAAFNKSQDEERGLSPAAKRLLRRLRQNCINVARLSQVMKAAIAELNEKMDTQGWFVQTEQPRGEGVWITKQERPERGIEAAYTGEEKRPC